MTKSNTITQYRGVPEWLPDGLLSRLQFVAWQFVFDETSKKPRKIPVNPATLQSASSTDPASWGSVDEILAAYEQNENLAGIGFVFSANDPYCGADLDNCITSTGELMPWAVSFLDLLMPTYMECSPSGKGIKAIVIAKKPDWAGCKKSGLGDKEGGFEIYDCKRFFTLTGNIYGPAQHPEILDRQKEIEAICNTLWPKHRGGPGAGQVVEALKDVSPLEMAEREIRCMAYIHKLPESIDGQGGSAACLRAACETQRFGLNNDAAWKCLDWFNKSKSVPPWSYDELQHKLDSAIKKVADEDAFGSRLTEPRKPKTIEKEDVVAIRIVKDTSPVVRLHIVEKSRS